MTAEMIIVNARVLTMDAAVPRAEAVALAGGRILAVGSRTEVQAFAGPETRVIDAGGRTLLPGFVESHLHIGLGGAELAHLQLGHVHGLDGLRAAFASFAAANPDKPLLMAQGGHYAMLDHPMTRADLDAVMPDRPIAITAHDHHTVWANTKALEAAGILHGMACPPGHEVVMGADGLASGELQEFEALAPVVALGGEGRLNLGIATGEEPAVPPSAAERAGDRAKIVAGLRHCAAHGITSMVTMDGNRYTLELLSEIRDEGNLSARVKVPFHFKPHMGLEALERASAMTRDFNDDWLQSGFVKLFMDGVVDSRTAYMLTDYPGHPGHRSMPLFAPDLFKAIATEIDRRGLQIAVHAIGDGAVRTTIDGYQAAALANGARDSRHRIEHIEMIDQSDVPRLGSLGIVASLQPPHAPGAMDFGMEPTLTTIGPARAADIYLSRSLRDAGAKLAFASDWPVTDVSVLRGLQAALTRPVYPGGVNEGIGLMDSLYAYTAGGAFAAHTDHITGRIMPGLAGDLVLLDGDIEAMAAGDIGQMGIALTICGGSITHKGAGFAG